MMNANRCHQALCARIGSSLCSLGLERDDIFDDTSLWEVLGTNQNKNLQRLQILSGLDWNELTRSLPDMIYLRELNLGSSHLNNAPIPSDDLLRSMRENGSLHNLVLPEFSVSNDVLRSVDAFCHRNRLADDVLLGNSSTAQAIVPNEASSTSINRAGNLLLAPLVFQVMEPVEWKAPNTLFLGLLAYDDIVGPDGDGKKRVL